MCVRACGISIYIDTTREQWLYRRTVAHTRLATSAHGGGRSKFAGTRAKNATRYRNGTLIVLRFCVCTTALASDFPLPFKWRNNTRFIAQADRQSRVSQMRAVCGRLAAG